MSLYTKPRILILIGFILLSIFILFSNGLKYGLDFSGGTEFVITLDKPISDPNVLSRINSTIAQRLDWSGLKDVRVINSGEQFIIVQVAVEDPKDIENIENLLQKQGRFESIFESKVLFTGDDVLSITKTPNSYYGISASQQSYKWTLPFVLSSTSARNFSEAIFHKCIPSITGEYDCPKTYFFIDRPTNAVLLIPEELYRNEEFLPADPLFPDSGSRVPVEELLTNADIPYIVFDNINDDLINNIIVLAEQNNKTELIVPYNVDLTKLSSLKMKIIQLQKNEPYPWIWDAIGLKSIIWLTSEITNQNAPTTSSPNFNIFYNLNISGSALTKEDAKQKLDLTEVLLSAGSLPVGVESISKETISANLGDKLLFYILLIGILAIILVAIVIFIRYKNMALIIPILVTSFSEVLLILGFASAIKWNLDLPALAGIIAAVGTGVDNQIIITDELMKDKDEKHEQSLLTRIKNAFFIIFATASTAFATMFPIILFSFGLGKLVGFALTTLAGVLVGILITRPVYAEMVKDILQNK